MFDKTEAYIAGKIIHYLSEPTARYAPFFAPDPQVFRSALKPGDILLIEGNSRVAAVIKFLTQSTWSHAALYLGERPGDVAPNGEPNVLLEAEADTGVATSPLSKYYKFHTRICRPVGLDAACDAASDRLRGGPDRQASTIQAYPGSAALYVSLPAGASLVSPPSAGDRRRRSDEGDLLDR